MDIMKSLTLDEMISLYEDKVRHFEYLKEKSIVSDCEIYCNNNNMQVLIYLKDYKRLLENKTQ